MKNLKKMLSSLVVAAMIASMAMVPAFAANSYEKEAEQLYKAKLYMGTSETEFVPDLGTLLDRQTGVVMILRMFGQEEEAKLLSDEQANSMLAKFTDAGTIADWAKKQVAYAVDKGVVKGYAEDSTFRPSAGLNGKAYCSLMLQQLGYNGDFDYHMAATKLAQAGGLNASQVALFNTDSQINKDSLVGISFGALQAKYKADGKKLVKVLLDNGNVTKENLDAAGIAYAEITSVAAVADVTVDIGATPTLPATVTATYDNGTTADVAVTWASVDTSAAGEKAVTGTIANTAVTASVKVIVVPAELRAELKSLGNLKEIAVVYNRPVADEDEAKDKTNYDVDGNTVANAELSADKMTVTLLLGTELDQQEDVEVTLDEDLGFEDDVELTLDNVKDTSDPAVAEVVAVGNGLVKVTFNEPVEYATGLSNYTIDGKLFGSSQPDLSDNGKTVEFELSSRLSAGAHKLVVKNKVVDFAGFSIEANETEFTVVEDTTAATATVKSATQIEVVIEFSEEVETPDLDDVDTNTSAEIESVEMDDDNKTFTIKFKVDDALPTAGGEITIEDLTDYSGNSVDFEINVTPTYDVERPEYVGYTVEEDQKQIVIEFNEEVLPNKGVFELTDADDDDVDVVLASLGDKPAENKGYYWDDDEDEYVKTKLVLVRKDGKVFDSEKHKLVISEVADNNPLENEIMKTTVTIDVDDQEAPSVEDESVFCDGNGDELTFGNSNEVYVEYSEEVDEDTATDLSNYSYIIDNKTNKMDKDLVDIELLSDNKTVCITFETDEDDSVDVDKIDYLQIESVTDLAGNEIDTESYELTDSAPTAPEITKAVVTDENTIVVTIVGSINENTLNPDDFYITAGKDDQNNDIVITAWDADYNSDDKEITLTVNADIESDATYGGNTIALKLEDADDVDTVNAFEQKLSIDAAIPVGDEYAPKADDSVASAVYANEGTVVFIELTEDLDLTDGAALGATDLAQFRVKADEDTVAATIEYYDADAEDDDDTDVDETCARLKVIIAEDYSDDKVQVIFYASANATIVDNATLGNALKDFDLSETVD